MALRSENLFSRFQERARRVISLRKRIIFLSLYYDILTEQRRSGQEMIPMISAKGGNKESKYSASGMNEKKLFSF